MRGEEESLLRTEVTIPQVWQCPWDLQSGAGRHREASDSSTRSLEGLVALERQAGLYGGLFVPVCLHLEILNGFEHHPVFSFLHHVLQRFQPALLQSGINLSPSRRQQLDLLPISFLSERQQEVYSTRTQ